MEDRDLWLSAQQMINIHGDKATDEACLRAIKLVSSSDLHGAAVWRRITLMIVELQREARREDEIVN